MAALVVSYSRVDQPIVRAVVGLLKTALRGVDETVFWDGELEPGQEWFEQLKRSIDAAPQLFVFWCAHSSASRQVRREFSYAWRRKKRVVPVLLDDTPLRGRLSAIQGIDLRGAVEGGKGLSRVREGALC
jgi:adenylate cyclase